MNKLRSDKREERKQRKTKPSILIAAEGKHLTEYNYFMGFNDYKSKYNINFVSGNETDPKSLVENLRKRWNKDGYSEEFKDIMFLIIDLDNNKEKAVLLKELINKNPDIFFIISNPCIETWFLFHFEENPKRLGSSKEVIRELKKYLKDYDKSRNYNKILYKNTSVAIKNSENKERLQNVNYDWPDVECNPRSDIHKIVKIIK